MYHGNLYDGTAKEQHLPQDTIAQTTNFLKKDAFTELKPDFIRFYSVLHCSMAC